AQAALGQRRVELQYEVEQLGGALRCRKRLGQRVRELVDFDALVATRDAQSAAIVQNFEHARGGDRSAAPAVDDARRPKRLLQLARMSRAVLADVSENALRQPRMLALDVPRVADRPRVQQVKRIPWQDTINV